MPPWGADSAHGTFANDPTLSAAEIATISEWTSAGAPEGDPSYAPKLTQFAEGWNINPEMVSEVLVAFPLPQREPSSTRIRRGHEVYGRSLDTGGRSPARQPMSSASRYRHVRQQGSTWLKDATPGSRMYLRRGREQAMWGFVFASKPRVERVYTYGIMSRDFVIPPQAADYPVRSEVTFTSGARVIALLATHAPARQVIAIPKQERGWRASDPSERAEV